MKFLILVVLALTSGSQNFFRELRLEIADLAQSWPSQKMQGCSTLAMQRGESIRTPKVTQINIMTVLVTDPTITVTVLWMMR